MLIFSIFDATSACLVVCLCHFLSNTHSAHSSKLSIHRNNKTPLHPHPLGPQLEPLSSQLVSEPASYFRNKRREINMRGNWTLLTNTLPRVAFGLQGRKATNMQCRVSAPCWMLQTMQIKTTRACVLKHKLAQRSFVPPH